MIPETTAKFADHRAALGDDHIEDPRVRSR